MSVSPFTSDEIHHCIAFLRTLLLPISKRNEFLACQYESPLSPVASASDGTAANPLDPVKDDLWILVDSDGDEDHSSNGGTSMTLKEKDLIAFLNQIPLEQMFR